jgi:DNA-binding CsgD family transcriptional regulator
VLELVDSGLDGGRFLADHGPEAAELAQAPMALIWIDELDRAAELSDLAILASRARGSVAGFVLNVGARAAVLDRRGALADAEAALREATSLAIQHGIHQWLFVSFMYGQDALMERSELADLATLIERLELPPELQPTMTGAVLAAARGSFAMLRGAVEQGIDALRECQATLEPLGFCNPNALDVRSALALALAGSAPDEARALANAALEDATRVGLPRGIGATLRTVGMIEGGKQGTARLQEAVAVLEHAPARLEHARALVELGAALRRANQRQTARGPLLAGLELAHRCRATRLQERARTELAAAGARPRRYVLSGADALTASERRVAELAAEGRSNPQIAQDLFVTVNTIETHLRRAYRKLDIRSRDQLTAALTRPRTERQSAAPS